MTPTQQRLHATLMSQHRFTEARTLKMGWDKHPTEKDAITARQVKAAIKLLESKGYSVHA